MATLTYWYCTCLDDHIAYGIRAKTKKEATAIREARGVDSFDEPRKNTVHYKDAFDLMTICMGEGQGYEY